MILFIAKTVTITPAFWLLFACSRRWALYNPVHLTIPVFVFTVFLMNKVEAVGDHKSAKAVDPAQNS